MSEIITCPPRLSGRIRGMKVREERVLGRSAAGEVRRPSRRAARGVLGGDDACRAKIEWELDLEEAIELVSNLGAESA